MPFFRRCTFFDYTGIVVSIACTIHCLCLPVLILLLPFKYNWFTNHLFEVLVVTVSLILAYFSLWHAYQKHHRKKNPLKIAGIGTVLLLFGLVWHNHEVVWELMPNVFGSLLVAWAHGLNIYYLSLTRK